MQPFDRKVKRAQRMPTLLAADIGGTNAVCGLFATTGGGARPDPIAVAQTATLDYDGIEPLLATFLETHAAGRTIEAAVVGVAGPVDDNASDLTNVPWRVDGSAIARRFSIRSVRLLNDLAAMGRAVTVLRADELVTLQEGRPDPEGNAALIAPGTGLGATILHRVDGRLVPVAAEPGHTDFAARTEAEIDLLHTLTERFGRVSLEHVLSGPGLVNIGTVTHRGAPCRVMDGAGARQGEDRRPHRITEAALSRRCHRCAAALDLFVGALGAEAGNLGLRAMASAGVHIGGGIAPHILPALNSPKFLDPFRAKGPMTGLMAAMPIQVIGAEQPALLGAAVAAAELAAQAAS